MAGKRGNGEGSVYQEKSGRWIAAVSVDGKRKRSVARTEAEAKRKLRGMLHQLDDGLAIGDGSLTLGGLLDQWMANHVMAQGLSPLKRPGNEDCSTL